MKEILIRLRFVNILRTVGGKIQKHSVVKSIVPGADHPFSVVVIKNSIRSRFEVV